MPSTESSCPSGPDCLPTLACPRRLAFRLRIPILSCVPPPQETRSWRLEEVAPGGHPHLGQQNLRVRVHRKAQPSGHRASTDRRAPGPPSGHSQAPEASLSLRSSPEVLLFCRVYTHYWVQRPDPRHAISSPAYGPQGRSWGQIDPANCVPFELADFVNPQRTDVIIPWLSFSPALFNLLCLMLNEGGKGLKGLNSYKENKTRYDGDARGELHGAHSISRA